MKKWPAQISYLVIGLLTGLLLSSIIFATLKRDGKNGGRAPVRELRLAHSLDTRHPVHAGLEYMAERLDVISQGQMRIKVYPSGQIGTETECIEKVQSGTLDMTKTSCSPLGSFIPAMRVFSMPYIFRDREHYWKTLDGDIGRSLLSELEHLSDGMPTGMRGLSYLDAGSRNFYSTSRPIDSPSDLRGMKIRVMNDPIAIAMIEAMGGAATPIAWGELYSALQQGVVDAAENNPPSYMSESHYEACPYFSFDEHTRIPDVIVISSATWNRLSNQERSWLEQAAAEASVFQRNLWQEKSDEAIEAMLAEGVQVIYPDKQPFRDSVAGLLDRYAGTPAGELAVRIRDSE